MDSPNLAASGPVPRASQRRSGRSAAGLTAVVHRVSLFGSGRYSHPLRLYKDGERPSMVGARSVVGRSVGGGLLFWKLGVDATVLRGKEGGDAVHDHIGVLIQFGAAHLAALR